MIKALQRLNQPLVSLSITLLVLLLLGALLPGFTLETPQGTVLALIGLSLVNTYLLPLAIRLTLPLGVLTFGLLPLFLNGLAVLLVAWIVPGFRVQDVGTAIAITFGMMISTALVTDSYVYKRERDRLRYQAIQRFSNRDAAAQADSSTGLILLEIDGLAEPILRRAIDEGHMPTLARWLQVGAYKLTDWETSLPSQTSSMQAGMLHGSHFNIPAFRFYDRAAQRMLVSNNPTLAPEIIRPLIDGNGVLNARGYSINNWTTGDADEVLLTFTAQNDLGSLVSKQADQLYTFFAQPYHVQRALVEMAADIGIEIWEAWRQRMQKVEPRIERRFPYPLVRAATTRLLPLISCELLVGKMFEGVEAAYTTFLGYDEVAHHSGIDRPDAFRILRQLDEQIRFITEAARETPRPYEFVVLSDHGQSMGATFRQRYGKTLAELVNELAGNADASLYQGDTSEGLGNINLLLTQLIGGRNRRAKALRRILRKQTHEAGYVELKAYASSPSSFRRYLKAIGRKSPPQPRPTPDGMTRTLVCASGNLAHIYFTEYERPLTAEEINAAFPDVIAGLAAHEGIGFVVVRRDENCAVVIGKRGVYHLDTGEIEGDNPLDSFGRNAALHLNQLMSYPNSGDIVVNSAYDAANDDTGAFEELVGSHGGLGGLQNQPFLLYPTALHPGPLPELVGAPAVYKLLKEWQTRLKAIDYRPTVLPLPRSTRLHARRRPAIAAAAILTAIQGILALLFTVPLLNLSVLLMQNPATAWLGGQGLVPEIANLLLAPVLLLAGIQLWQLRRHALDLAILAHAATVCISTLNLLSQPPGTRESLWAFAGAIALHAVVLLFLLFNQRVRQTFG